MFSGHLKFHFDVTLSCDKWVSCLLSKSFH